MSFSLKRGQRKLGPRSFFICVLTIDLIAILAIDMYAPALPSMQNTFDVSIGYLNLTMFAFFFVSAFATFLAGPLSDCFGRKPPLLIATGLFAVSSFGCALSPSVEALVLFRVLQGVGVGGVQTLATALIQDAYSDDSVQTAMTFLQSLVIIGPVLVPFLGSFALMVTDWRGIFGVLGALGVTAVLLACTISETHVVDRKRDGSLGASLHKIMGDCRDLVSQRSFTSLALIMGFAGVPFFALIATVSYILMNDFALDYLGYSLIYAATCLLDCIAPFVYLALSKRMPNKRILRLSFVLIGVSGVTLLVAGHLSPVIFFLAFAPYALSEGIIRPLAYVDLLDQPEDKVGSASSLVNFSYVLITAVATVVATMDWPSLIFGLAVITIGTLLCVLALYWWGQRESLQ